MIEQTTITAISNSKVILQDKRVNGLRNGYSRRAYSGSQSLDFPRIGNRKQGLISVTIYPTIEDSVLRRVRFDNRNQAVTTGFKAIFRVRGASDSGLISGIPS